MAQLAIRGHATRGNEVIEILEMLGGKSKDNIKGYNNDSYYYIAKDGLIYCSGIEYEELACNYTIFALEEFLEKFPYKVGDFVSIPEYESEVRICEMRWDGIEIQYKVYRVDEEEWYTSDELLNYNDNPNGTITMETITIDDFKANTKEWLIDKLESMSKDNALQAICNIHDELHKPQYPQTFEECCTVLGLTELGIIGGYRHGLLTQFRNLLICRDAYWKIADDWKFNFEEKCYYLCNEYHEIQDFNGVCDCNAVLAFPTAEMRDAFYDNFEELIKECKSLL